MSLNVKAPKRSLRTVVLSVWNVIRNGWHLLVWEDVRAGTIDLSETPRSFRMLMRFGMWLTILTLLGLIFSNGWRGISPLLPLTFYNDDLAGLYIPEYLVPLMFGLLAIAWAFLLTGVLHTPWYAKLFGLFLFALFDYGLMLTPLSLFLGEIDLLLSGFSLGQVGLWNTAAVLITGAGWLLLVGLFLIRWRRLVNPGFEFSLVLALISLLLFSAHFATQFGVAVTQGQATVSALQLTSALGQIDTILNPFLVITGVEIVLLGMSMTRMVCKSLIRRKDWHTGRGKLGWVFGLGAFLMFRLWQVWIWPLLTGADLYFSWGSTLIGIMLVPVFFLVYQRHFPRTMPGWVIPGAAVLLFSVLFIIQIGYLFLGTVGIGFVLAGAPTTGEAIIEIASQIFDRLAEWNIVWVSLAAFLAGSVIWLRARLKRQPVPTTVLYAIIFVIWALWWGITRTGHPLEKFYFRYEHVTAVATLFLLGFYLGGILFRRLSPRFLLHLSAAALLFWLLDSREWLDDPFSPLFVWLGAQAALISVSIFLNVMNAGNRFALNVENSRWPRMARGFLYFGYALLTVLSMLWLVAGHHTNALTTNEVLVNSGYGIIGIPLVFWALMVGSTDIFGESEMGATLTESASTGSTPVIEG